MTGLDHATGQVSRASRWHPAVSGARVGTGAGWPFASAEAWDDPPADPAANAGSEVVVGIVDTGLVVREGRLHPYLEAQRQRIDVVGDWAEPDPGAPYSAEFGHGTFVTGLILRQAPACRVRVGRGLLAADADAALEDRGIAALIEGLVADRVQLLNLSFAGRLDPGAEDIVTALRKAVEAGVLVVCAVSNDPTSGPEDNVPAVLADPDGGFADLVGTVLPVVAADESMRRLSIGGDRSTDAVVAEPPTARFAWRPEGADWLSCRANGVAVLGPYPRWDAPFAGWARSSGSSFAAAQFTGFLAEETRVRSLTEPGITPVQVAAALGLFDGGHYYYAADSRWRAEPQRA